MPVALALAAPAPTVVSGSAAAAGSDVDDDDDAEDVDDEMFVFELVVADRDALVALEGDRLPPFSANWSKKKRIRKTSFFLLFWFFFFFFFFFLVALTRATSETITEGVVVERREIQIVNTTRTITTTSIEIRQKKRKVFRNISLILFDARAGDHWPSVRTASSKIEIGQAQFRSNQYIRIESAMGNWTIGQFDNLTPAVESCENQ
jgi:hypothetical protein